MLGSCVGVRIPKRMRCAQLERASTRNHSAPSLPTGPSATAALLVPPSRRKLTSISCSGPITELLSALSRAKVLKHRRLKPRHGHVDRLQYGHVGVLPRLREATLHRLHLFNAVMSHVEMPLLCSVAVTFLRVDILLDENKAVLPLSDHLSHVLLSIGHVKFMSLVDFALALHQLGVVDLKCLLCLDEVPCDAARLILDGFRNGDVHKVVKVGLPKVESICGMRQPLFLGHSHLPVLLIFNILAHASQMLVK
mmetsp:Transcript_18183/g.52228  ORF Transcript_18183/g.52228 Transcript_18183/m.52228 type:complete len:252 (+) Transcript_18183:445-1200(+)